jgi:hypothetical protein
MVAHVMRVLAAATTLVVWLALAAPAFASDNGEGLLGETDDRLVTFFCFGVMIFIVIFVTLASLLQGRLEKRKQQRKAVELRRSVGW